MPCTGEGVAAAVQQLLFGRALGAGATAAGSSDDASAAAAAAVATLDRALAANAAYVQGVLKRPFLRDSPGAQPAHAAPLGTDVGVIAGARVRITITRAVLSVTPAHEAAIAVALGSREGAGDAARALTLALRALDVGAAASGVRLVASAGPAGGAAFELLAREGEHFLCTPPLPLT